MTERPLLAITMGDPAGVGAEVIVGALTRRRVRAVCQPLVIGDARAMAHVMELVGRRVALRVVKSAEEARGFPAQVCLLDLHSADPETIPLGQVSAAAGKAAAEYIETAVSLALAGEVAGVVTAPINKEALRLAGVPYPGHTEMLAARCGAREVAMLLVHGEMRVAHVTTHISVREACNRITQSRVLSVIRLVEKALQQMDLPRRRIAVGGLNPHAGEAGLFGGEELHRIIPAIEDAVSEGIDAVGPLPPDTVFARQRAGEFDAVVAMLHDHGHIAIKTVGFTGMRVAGVNVTLGLPIIRTSVDHGTAFDLAGKGTADATSMVEAIVMAGGMAVARRTGLPQG